MQDRRPPSAGTSPLRIVTANALKYNKAPSAWAEALLDLDPDVLCVQELTPAIDDALAATGRLPAAACTEVRDDSAGTGLWCRWPLADAGVFDAGHTMIVGRVESLGVTLASIHTIAPSSPAKAREWEASFAAIAALTERTAGPLVVAGDWNATLAHGPLRDLLAAGRVRDAHVDAGRRFARTWPARVPLALLDRVLVSRHMAVRSVSEVRLPGSDHRAVAAELTIVRAQK